MKKKFAVLYSLLIAGFLFLNKDAEAQGESVGIGTDKPHASAILDVNSVTKGFLPPRMTKDERDAIVSPATGLLIYQSDSNPGFYFYLNGWQPLTASSGGGANNSLSNLLSPTAINADLLPGNSAVNSIGSSALSWKDIYFYGDAFLEGNRFLSSRGTNVFLGIATGNSSITGFYNTAAGSNSLTTNISGNWNTATGYESLYSSYNGSSNTASGFQSLIANANGSYNSGMGVLTLANNISGTGNSAMGVGGLTSSTGSYNSSIGYAAGGSLQSGNDNTFLGAYADGSFGASLSNATAIGYQASVTASNTVRVGNSSVTSIGGQVNWTAFSDGRFKINVKQNVPGLQFINQLKAVTYNLDVNSIDKTLRPNTSADKKMPLALGNKKGATTQEINAKQEKKSIVYTGFIAQDVEAAAKRVGYNFSGVDVPKNGNDFYGLRYAEFVVPLVKSVQELSAKSDLLEKENSQLKRDIVTTTVKQQSQIANQQKEIDALKTIVLQMQKEMASAKTISEKK